MCYWGDFCLLCLVDRLCWFGVVFLMFDWIEIDYLVIDVFVWFVVFDVWIGINIGWILVFVNFWGGNDWWGLCVVNSGVCVCDDYFGGIFGVSVGIFGGIVVNCDVGIVYCCGNFFWGCGGGNYWF